MPTSIIALGGLGFLGSVLQLLWAWCKQLLGSCPHRDLPLDGCTTLSRTLMTGHLLIGLIELRDRFIEAPVGLQTARGDDVGVGEVLSAGEPVVGCASQRHDDPKPDWRRVGIPVTPVTSHVVVGVLRRPAHVRNRKHQGSASRRGGGLRCRRACRSDAA
jgi:hypothetical protein